MNGKDTASGSPTGEYASRLAYVGAVEDVRIALFAKQGEFLVEVFVIIGGSAWYRCEKQLIVVSFAFFFYWNLC